MLSTCLNCSPIHKHPHGLTDTDYDALFTKDKPIIFAFHGYPTLIHELTYYRHNKHNLHRITAIRKKERLQHRLICVSRMKSTVFIW